MEPFAVYKDIQARTKGQFLVGVVGPVRTGKSTFIRRFMELLALPAMDELLRAEVRDQLPLSGSGKTITTVEPKFIPKEAIDITLDEDIPVKIRLIDCVGFMVPDASGNMENERERMVKTPWFEQEIPFHQAAEIGTKKVIQEHSTIGLVVTCDGSFGEIPRKNFEESEERTVQELKKQGKPFLILVNSQKPYREETLRLVEQLQDKYQAAALSVNCEQLRKEDILRILEKILYEFPVHQVEFYIPKWVELLEETHYIKSDLLQQIKNIMGELRYIRDIKNENMTISSEYVKSTMIEEINLSNGVVKVRMEMKEPYYYQVMSEMTGVLITGEYQLINTLRELAKMKEEYVKVQHAIEAVRGTGYGVVIPEMAEIKLDEPMVIHQGNKYGVKIKSTSPSIHMIKANIETEIAPIVGSEEQAKDLIAFIQESAKTQDGIWKTNIFGKSIEQLVEDGIRTKLAQISEESQVKLQDTMQKIVNDSKGGMICIII
ncbi:MAG: stage IV sporulation protein A [Clostridia bacterium]|nr:stage IV sporulation protein A [Clostridia bacterium]NCC43436.1 stage IV sporulation protein A [Clostridia bacterium]